MNNFEEKQDQLIRETFDQCLSGIDRLPSARPEIMSKLKQKTKKWEPTRFRIPAIAAMLVIVLCVGILAGSGRLGLSPRPDEIKGNSQYTVQPIDIPLTQGGQNTAQESAPAEAGIPAADNGSQSDEPEFYSYPDTVLYYNPDGGTKYHIDPNCTLINKRYLPMQGHFLYSEINEAPFNQLERCNVCGAPLRPKANAEDLPEEHRDRPVTVSMELAKNSFDLEESVHAEITVMNTWDEDLPGSVTLYGPDGLTIDEFTLAAGGEKQWSGEIAVTQEQLEEGKVTCSVQYSTNDGPADEDGTPGLNIHRISFSKRITWTGTPEVVELPQASISDADLELYRPGLSTDIKPVSYTCEKQGIRLSVTAGLAEEKNAWFTYTLEDPEGKLFREDPSFSIDPVFTLAYENYKTEWIHTVASDVNPDERQATCVGHFSLDKPLQAENGIITTGMINPAVYEHATVDLLPFLNEYGKVSEGVGLEGRPYSPYEGAESPKLPDNPKVLDYNHPLDIPLFKDIVLTGIGWIDNQLHVQVHYTGSRPILKGDSLRTWTAGTCNIVSSGNVNFSELNWGNPGPGEKTDNDWVEFIWDTTPEDIHEELTISISYPVDMVKDTWSFEIPIEAIRAGETAAAYQPGSNPLKVTMGTSVDTYTGEETYAIAVMTNISDHTLPGPITFRDSEGRETLGFRNELLVGETEAAYIDLVVTPEEMEAGKINFSVEYSDYDGPLDEDGNPTLRRHKAWYSTPITLSERTEPESAPAEAGIPAADNGSQSGEPEFYSYPDTVLYYNPDGGTYYHIDPNCTKVNKKYQPLQAHFTYAQLNDEPYSSLERCNICGAPLRPKANAEDLPEERRDRPVTVSMELAKNSFDLEESVHAEITVMNTWGEDLPGPVTLYGPDGLTIDEFNLAAGGEKQWSGEIAVTQEQLEEGKITCSVQYSTSDGPADEDGTPGLNIHRISFSKRITWTGTPEVVELPQASISDAELEADHPGLSTDMKPVSYTCEKQGIRLSVTAGLVGGENAWFTYTLEDPEGKLRWEEPCRFEPVFTLEFGNYREEGCSIVDSAINPDDRQATYVGRFYLDKPLQAKNGSITTGMMDPVVYERATVDLIPLLNEYGKVSNGVGLEVLSFSGHEGSDTPKLPEKPTVLDYHQPLDIPLYKDIVLTGIGWIDNQLHVQVHYTGSRPILKDSSSIWTATSTHVVSRGGVSSCELEWADPGPGEKLDNDWIEFIWDTAPEDIPEKLEIEFFYPVDMVKDNWSLEIPFEAVKAGETAAVYQPGSNPLKVTMGTSVDTYTGEETYAVAVLTNISDHTLPGPIIFRDSEGRETARFDENLPAGEIDYDYIDLVVTPEEMEAGKINFSVKYSDYDGPLDGNGNPMLQKHTAWYSTPITLSERTEPESAPAEPAAEASMETSADAPAETWESIRLSDGVIEMLKGWYGVTPDDLKPVNLVKEDHGIRVNLLSAILKDEDLLFIYEVDDLESRRISEEGETIIDALTFDKGESGLTLSTTQLERADEEHRPVYCGEIKYDHALSAGSTITTGINNFRVDRVVPLDLTSLLKEYAVETEGIALPEKALFEYQHGYQDRPSLPEGMKFLDYTHPLDIPLAGDISLTGIGWIDGQLHVQLHHSGESRIKVDGFIAPVWDASVTCHLQDADDPDFHKIVWNENGDLYFNWYEFIWDCAPADIDRISLPGEITYFTKVIEGDWRFDIPVSSILADPGSGFNIPDISIGEPETVSAEPPTELRELNKLARNYPSLTETLQPLYISCEDQGIRICVNYGVVTGQQAQFIYTLEDPECKLIREGPGPLVWIKCSDNDEFTNCYNSGIGSPSVDYERHTASFTGFIQLDSSFRPEDGLMRLRFTSPVNELTGRIDMIPLLKKYGKIVKGVQAPEGLNRFTFGDNAPKLPDNLQNLNVLDYTQPLNHPIAQDTVLTGVGWIDNQLHMQFHYTGEGKIPSNVREKNWWVTPYAELNDSSLPYAGVEWDEDRDGQVDWMELILDCASDTIWDLTLYADPYLVTDVIDGDWSVSVPLSLIQVEEPSAEPAAEAPEAAEETGERPVKVTMNLDKTRLHADDTVDLTITVTNLRDEDLPGSVTLFDPNGEATEFQLPADHTLDIITPWKVTAEQLEEGKITCRLEYQAYDGPAGEDGLPTLRHHAVSFSKKISAAE